MRTILYLIRKEFKQIFRNKGLLPMIIMMPIIQLLVLAKAADFEVKEITFSVIDYDHSSLSGELIDKIANTPRFNFVEYLYSTKESEILLEQGEIDFVLIIESNFEKEILTNQGGDLQIVIDAVNATKAGIASAYVQSVIRDFTRQKFSMGQTEEIAIIQRNWFNSDLNYVSYMVPGILVLLVTMIGMFITSMNIAREKEIGTIEQLNVTPMKKYHFIAGKLIPMWIIGCLELFIGLLIAYYVYKVPVNGSLIDIFIFCSIYLIIMLSLGLIISTKSETQQQAMFVAYFFTMVFIFLSGLFTSVASMPGWAQFLSKIIPISYFIEVMRSILLKGTPLIEMLRHLYVLTGFAVLTLTVAIWQYKKVI